jgi:hypothetical protein
MGYLSGAFAMSAVRSVNSKAASRTVWGVLAVLFGALLLYANHADIASYAKTVARHHSAVQEQHAGGGAVLGGSAELFW